MAVEIAGTYLHWPPPLPARNHLSAKTVALAISALLQSPSKPPLDRHIPFLTTTLHRPHQTRTPTVGGRRASSSPTPSLDPENDEQFASPSSVGGDSFALQKMEWRAANRFDLPLSLRIIKRKKKRWDEESTCDAAAPSSSVKRAFSSMVFMVGELQSHAIRMRKEHSLSGDSQLRGVLARVHGELHDSFAWLFHRIFSSTPTLMLYLMLLLANFAVFSVSQNSAFKAFSVCGETPVVVGDEGGAMAATAWRMVVEETGEMMRAAGRHELLMDSDTIRLFVSPVTAVSEPDDLSVYSATELSYRVAIAENPDDALFLSNFAQFLYTVYRDHDRAEEYFKRAVGVEPAEAETLSRYANFLWVARKDLGAAEEAFLEAISADPANSYYSASYAHFLWSTGGEETCYPLDDCDT